MHRPPTTSRRRLLQQAACGFGSLALAGLCHEAAAADEAAPLAPRAPHRQPRARRVIFLFMQGGPSQVDTFDPKPQLDRLDGRELPLRVDRTRTTTSVRIMKSLWPFRRYGECGQPVSELFPQLAGHVDDLCFLHGMHTEGVAHGPATLFLHTGATNLIRPSVGAWVTYGLGTENQNLPGFVTIGPPPTKGGPRNYGSAFLPAVFQGTAIGRPGVPASQAKIRHLLGDHLTPVEQRQQLDLLQAVNRQQAAGTEDDLRMGAVIESFELAYRMQVNAPQVMDISNETRETRRLYGIGHQPTDNFGRQCLLARRLSEAGVRYVQVSYADNSATPCWDQHSNMPKHADHARATDQPVAALLSDLKRRGLLDETLVWWGGEFGRTPFAQGRNGRDHNPGGFTMFLAGGGVRGGLRFGETDELGFRAVSGRIHMRDLHATILYLLGLEHEQLTYRYAGRDFRLTDVSGRLVHEILA